MRSPDHPILAKPWEYVVAELYYRTGLDESPSFLDLTLVRGAVRRRLRFVSPLDLRIERGFPQPTHGLCILDVRDRGLEGVTVEVSDFEAGGGAIRFLARDVIDLDAPPSGPR